MSTSSSIRYRTRSATAAAAAANAVSASASSPVSAAPAQSTKIPTVVCNDSLWVRRRQNNITASYNPTVKTTYIVEPKVVPNSNPRRVKTRASGAVTPIPPAPFTRVARKLPVEPTSTLAVQNSAEPRPTIRQPRQRASTKWLNLARPPVSSKYHGWNDTWDRDYNGHKSNTRQERLDDYHERNVYGPTDHVTPDGYVCDGFVVDETLDSSDDGGENSDEDSGDDDFEDISISNVLDECDNESCSTTSTATATASTVGSASSDSATSDSESESESDMSFEIR